MARQLGRWIGKRPLAGKTTKGDLACFVSCMAVGLTYPTIELSLSWLIIPTGAGVASIIEAVNLPINVNLTMLLLSGAVMTLTNYLASAPFASKAVIIG
jgi:hypothetical protein